MKTNSHKQSILLGVFICLLTFTSCKSDKKIAVENDESTVVVISDSLKWSERMALSVMKRYPEAWKVQDTEKPKWNYKHGLLTFSFEQLYRKTGKQKYFDYDNAYAKKLIDSTGVILNYDIEKYNIDMINAGKTLFFLYDKTKDERYLSALKTLRKQLEGQPRTPSGGFWHKKIYPNQMWLDGLYMGAPFYAQYTKEFENGRGFDDIAKQFELIYSKTLDTDTGMLFHAWDESKAMDWADKETGLAPNFWSRSMGWYVMALVDVLDYFPEDHSKRQALIDILNNVSTALVKVQDESGVWYQVPNLAGKEGNYLETSSTAMFAYGFAKGVKNGYLSEEFLKVANHAFDGLIKLVTVDDDGEIHITQVCKSAGLGGNPYRDGSFEYYISEPIVTDNLHGTGPFILAALALNR